ncbi:MAG: hypothetical protein ACJZ8R_00355 [Pseudohongiellaceae bacterium]
MFPKILTITLCLVCSIAFSYETSSYDQGTITVPSVVVGDKAYRVSLVVSPCTQTCVTIESAVEVTPPQNASGTYFDGELTVHSVDVSGKLYSASFQLSNLALYEFTLLNAELIGVKTDPNSMYFSWDTGYGTPAEEKPQRGFETIDGGFIACGSGGNDTANDVLIMKIDRNGNLVWQQQFGSTNNKSDIGYDCLEIEDGIIVAGAQTYSSSSTQERWLAKLDKETGSQIWERYYSIDQLGQEQRNDFVADAIHEVILGADGMLYATGYLGAELLGFAFMAQGGTSFLMKIDPKSGQLIDENIMSNQGLTFGSSVVESDGGIYVIGTYDGDKMGISFFNKDSLALEWTKFYPCGKESENCENDAGWGNLGLNATHGVGGGVVTVGHYPMEVKDETKEWEPFQIKVIKWKPTGGVPPYLELEWEQNYYNPREFEPIDGDHFMRNEAWGIVTVQKKDGYPNDGYIFVAGDGDETGDVDAKSTKFPDLPSSSIWMAYVGYLGVDGSRYWDDVYMTDSLTDPGNEAGEYISTTSDAGLMLFIDSDIKTENPNAFGFTKLIQ